jgi:hypothetical protein
MTKENIRYKRKAIQVMGLCVATAILDVLGFVNKPNNLSSENTLLSEQESASIVESFQGFEDSVEPSDLELIATQEPSTQKQPVQELSSKGDDYKTLRSYLGIPYGPVYPKGPDKDKKHLDCISILYEFAKYKGIILTGSEGDKIYARHTKHITTLTKKEKELEDIKTGDFVFIGHPYARGEGNISALHNGIIGKPIYDINGHLIDFTMIHASGAYGKDRATQYRGRGVIECSLIDYMKQSENNPRKTHAFIGRLIDNS